MKIINLFNNAHNGDIFYSRMVINELIKNGFNVNYFHNNLQNLVNDIKNCNYCGRIDINKNEDFNKNTFNTWIGKDNAKFLDDKGCCFENNKKLTLDILLNYNIQPSVDKDMLPQIYFNNLDTESMVDSLNYISERKKVILICNNDTKSGQSVNFKFDDIVLNLANNFKKFNYLFIVSNDIGIENENVIPASSIIKDKENELLKIGYLSTFCDVIVGRASGPFCFTHVKQNLMSENKKYISFTNKREEGVWFEKSKATQIWYDEFCEYEVLKLIQRNIL